MGGASRAVVNSKKEEKPVVGIQIPLFGDGWWFTLRRSQIRKFAQILRGVDEQSLVDFTDGLGVEGLVWQELIRVFCIISLDDDAQTLKNIMNFIKHVSPEDKLLYKWILRLQRRHGVKFDVKNNRITYKDPKNGVVWIVQWFV